MSLDDVLGARVLAWAGGVVTLLGVVFLFALAANRGWIGPVERVALGALASSLVFAAGVPSRRRRYGQLYAALSAVGAGIAGGYATLLAAAAALRARAGPGGARDRRRASRPWVSGSPLAWVWRRSLPASG